MKEKILYPKILVFFIARCLGYECRGIQITWLADGSKHHRPVKLEFEE